ncbi:hypothetical protein ACIBD9_06955 [Micromonospora sp. NPDC050784]|uniref:hypothetical protein n=1 Tax=Micromonospora sp. NPDC050784 TaxID=3364281 RepID=UPI00379C3641
MTAPVVVCPDCDGMTFSLKPCRCTTYGDWFLADADALGPRREAYRSCEQCRGAGTVAYPCYRCGRLGRRRAQLVVGGRPHVASRPLLKAIEDPMFESG